MTYLNCAATSFLRPPCVAEAVCRALAECGSSGRGAHPSELAAGRVVWQAREALASLVGASHPERVVFAHNATAGLNMAILGTVRPGSRVVATDWDHNSVLRPLYRLRDEQGVRLDFAPAAELTGSLDTEVLVDLIEGRGEAFDGGCDPRPLDLVVLTHASNVTGNVLPDESIARVADAAHAAGALLLLDAAQSVGERPIEMEALGVDMLAFTGHKALMGPQGTGGLVVAPGVDVHPVIRGGTGVLSFEEGQPAAWPEHLEAGTVNSHGLAGLAAAMAWVAEEGVPSIHRRTLALTRRLVEGAREAGATVYGDFPARLSDPFDHAPVVSVNLAGWDSSSLADELGRVYDIAVRAGAHCAPRMHRALGTGDAGCVRFSMGALTPESDVEAAVEALRELASEEG